MLIHSIKTNEPTQVGRDMTKSTVDQIRQRFDADVERFSNFETGQSANSRLCYNQGNTKGQ
jgi:hypothetical protein